MNTIIYKEIEIVKTENGYYKFIFNGIVYTNTNIHFAKRMITFCIKNLSNNQ